MHGIVAVQVRARRGSGGTGVYVWVERQQQREIMEGQSVHRYMLEEVVVVLVRSPWQSQCCNVARVGRVLCVVTV